MSKLNSNEGWIAIHRKILKSEIWLQEPWRLKVWLYMLLQANHAEKTEFGQKLERGQLLVNRIEDFRKEVKWRKGFAYEIPTRSAMKSLWKWLRDRGMVDTKRTTRGTIITILNYSAFQDKPNKLVATKVATIVATKAKPSVAHDRQQCKQLNNPRLVKPTAEDIPKRKKIKFPKEWQDTILKEYQKLNNIVLQGSEIKPVLQTIKTMFMNDRSVNDVVGCMKWLAKGDETWKKNWTINTVNKKIPFYLKEKDYNSWKYVR